MIDRRAIPFAMPWRHHDSDVSDPFPHGEYNEVHADFLASFVVEPCQVPHEFLYMLGLSTYWKYPGYRGALRDQGGRGIAFSLYICCASMSFLFCRVYLLYFHVYVQLSLCLTI